MRVCVGWVYVWAPPHTHLVHACVSWVGVCVGTPLHIHLVHACVLGGCMCGHPPTHTPSPCVCWMGGVSCTPTTSSGQVCVGGQPGKRWYTRGGQLAGAILLANQLTPPHHPHAHPLPPQLCRGASREDASSWQLGPPDSFNLLNQSSCQTLEGVDDALEYEVGRPGRHTHTCTSAHMHTHAYTHMHTYIHAHTQTHIHASPPPHTTHTPYESLPACLIQTHTYSSDVCPQLCAAMCHILLY